jgi:glycosyltransferase involved in cell wall biosynthesis
MSTQNKRTPHPDSISPDNTPLKILMIDSHASVQRGGAVQCASLALALARRGHSVICIFDGSPDQPLEGLWFDSLRSAGVRLLRLGLESPAAMLRLRRMLATERPDILHTHKNSALFFAYFATLGMRRPVWTANRGTVYPLSLSRLAHFIHRRHVARMFAVAQAVKDALVNDGIPAEKVDVAYGSFDPERFSPAISGQAMRQSWQVPPETPLVGLIGSLNTPKKGHQVLLEAATILKEKCPDLRFVLVAKAIRAHLRLRLPPWESPTGSSSPASPRTYRPRWLPWTSSSAHPCVARD